MKTSQRGLIYHLVESKAERLGKKMDVNLKYMMIPIKKEHLL